MDIVERISRHIKQLAPHQFEREQALLLMAAKDEIEKLNKIIELSDKHHASEIDALQAQVDRVMLEYCPDEMTAEQIANWGRHQKPVLSHVATKSQS